MKKILLPLLLGLSSLLGNDIVGTWTIDEKNTKDALKSSLLLGNELVFVERYILHTMKSLQCSDDHTCLIPELHNSNPHTGKYTWKTTDETYLLEGNHKPLKIIFVDSRAIKMIVSDISRTKLEIFYTKNKNTTLEPIHKITSQKTIAVTKKMIHTITSAKKPIDKSKISTHKRVNLPKQKLHISKEPIINIDIEAEKLEKKRKLEKAYLNATMDVM